MKAFQVTTDRNVRGKMILIAVLSGVAANISAWQTRHFHQIRGGDLSVNVFCQIGEIFDCSAIEMSAYSELLPGFPVSALAMAAYFLIGTVAVFGIHAPCVNSARVTLRVLTGIAAAASIYYLWVMVFAIGKGCMLCLFIDAINAILFFTAWRLRLENGTTSFVRYWNASVATTGIVAVSSSVFLNLKMESSTRIKQSDLDAIVERVLSTPSEPITLPEGLSEVGPKDAPLTLIKFGDYECPPCRIADAQIEALMKIYSEEIRYIFVNLPLSSECNPELQSNAHPNACEAALISLCAEKQDAFPEVHELLFKKQDEFVSGEINTLLGSLTSLDHSELQQCLESPESNELLRRDIQFATVMKIDATPTFFLNGRRIEGGMPTSVWVQLVERTLNDSRQ